MITSYTITLGYLLLTSYSLVSIIFGTQAPQYSYTCIIPAAFYIAGAFALIFPVCTFFSCMIYKIGVRGIFFR